MHLSDRFTSGIVPIMAVSALALYIGLVLYMAIEAWPALIHMSWTGYCNRYSLEAYGTKSCIRSGLYYFC